MIFKSRVANLIDQRLMWRHLSSICFIGFVPSGTIWCFCLIDPQAATFSASYLILFDLIRIFALVFEAPLGYSLVTVFTPVATLVLVCQTIFFGPLLFAILFVYVRSDIFHELVHTVIDTQEKCFDSGMCDCEAEKNGSGLDVKLHWGFL